MTRGELVPYHRVDGRALVALLTEERDTQIGHLVCVPGLTEGLCEPRSYFDALVEAVGDTYRVVSPLLRSSYYGYGVQSLRDDADDLAALIDFLQQQHDGDSATPRRRVPGRLALLGFSTGCQDMVTLLRHHRERLRDVLDLVVLQAPVSDRECMCMEAGHAEELERVRRLRATHGERALLDWHAPLVYTAYRYLSLAERLGDDDLFSSDLTRDEMERRLGHLRDALPPTARLVSVHGTADETVPRGDTGARARRKLQHVTRADALVLRGAGHDLTARHGADRMRCVRAFARFWRDELLPHVRAGAGSAKQSRARVYLDDGSNDGGGGDRDAAEADRDGIARAFADHAPDWPPQRS